MMLLHAVLQAVQAGFRFVLFACSAVWKTKHHHVCINQRVKKWLQSHRLLSIYLSHTLRFFPPFLLHLSAALPAATHLRTQQRKWGNQLQSGGGWCVRTIVAPGGRMSLWIGGSFMKLLNPVAFPVFLFLFLFSESIGGLFAHHQTAAPADGVKSRSRKFFNQNVYAHAPHTGMQSMWRARMDKATEWNS